jgi:hypothetical protein
VGGASVFGTSFAMSDLLARHARAATTEANADADEKAVKGTSLIYVFLKGGLSTIDTFDMKPDAPAEIRGPFGSIPTKVPGLRVCEHLPHVAGQMDKVSLIRSFTHTNSNHGLADHYMLTGYNPSPAFKKALVPNNERPAHGSIIARKLGARGPVPPYVCLPRMHASAGPAYLGAGVSPFVIAADPNAPDFAVPDLVPPLDLDATRLSSRQALLGQVDRFQRAAEAQANKRARTMSVFRQKAFDLMTSPEAKRAFAIEDEPDTLRDEYGRHTLGQSCLMARRLVEAGVRCVTVSHSDWDTHGDNFNMLENDLLPQLDTAMGTLFRDLADRGMLDSTLVIVTGEFGRTPRINAAAGRDHWSSVFTVAMGGGGVQGGRVIGASDDRAEKPASDAYSPEDLAATLYHLFGIDPDEEFHSAEGRPFKIVNDGQVVQKML